MNLADVLAAEPPRKGGQRCMTYTWLDELGVEDERTLNAAVRNPNDQLIRIYRALSKAYDLPMGEAAFGHHFRHGHDEQREQASDA